MAKSIAVKLLCMGCQSDTLTMFYSDTSIEPEELGTTFERPFTSLAIIEQMEGKYAICSECGAVNVTYIHWDMMPPELRTRVTEGTVYHQSARDFK